MIDENNLIPQEPKGKEEKKQSQTVESSSISTTKSCLVQNLNCIPDFDQNFISVNCMTRPPFSFIHNIVKLFVEKLNFAHGLYESSELERDHQSLSRQEKIRFLFKVFACVSIITKERIDMFVSPAKVLSGQDVHLTHFFLQNLSKAAMVPSEISRKHAEKIIETGVNQIYKRSVKTRNILIMIQARIRGYLTRLRLMQKEAQLPKGKLGIEPIPTSTKACLDKEQNDTTLSNVNSSHSTIASKISNKEDSVTTILEVKDSSKITKSLNSPYHCTRSKSKVKTSTNKAVPQTKFLKKVKIVNGMKVIDVIEVEQKVESEENDKIKSREEEVSDMLSQLRMRLKKLQKRESKLELKIEATRLKEEQIDVCESRLSRLANSLRKKEEKLKQDKIKQIMEIDKMRLEVSEMSLKYTTDVEKPKDNTNDDNELKYEELWKRACSNPTITDLRLKLEAKEKALERRQDKVIKLEKAFKRRLSEVEDERKKVEDQKKAFYESTKKATRQKKPSNIPKKIIVTNSSKNHMTKDIMISDEKESARRQALHGITAVEPTLLRRLAEISEARGKRKNENNSNHNMGEKWSTVNLSTANNIGSNTLSMQKTSDQCSCETPPSTRTRSEVYCISRNNNRDVADDVLPRSLARYSSHYGKIQKRATV